MRIINVERIKKVLGDLPEIPRVVASGNFAIPKVLLGAVDAVVPEYRPHMRREGTNDPGLIARQARMIAVGCISSSRRTRGG